MPSWEFRWLDWGLSHADFSSNASIIWCICRLLPETTDGKIGALVPVKCHTIESILNLNIFKILGIILIKIESKAWVDL
jgi:hypothetical protein